MANIVNTIIREYIKVYGEEKWNSFTGEEQREVIMAIVKDMTKALERM